MTGNVGVMPDNLRERIAKVLYGNLRRQQSIDRPDRFLDWIDTRELADAVIEALELDVSDGPIKLVNCAYCDYEGTPEELTTQHLNECP